MLLRAGVQTVVKDKRRREPQQKSMKELPEQHEDIRGMLMSGINGRGSQAVGGRGAGYFDSQCSPLGTLGRRRCRWVRAYRARLGGVFVREQNFLQKVLSMRPPAESQGEQ